MSVEASPRGGVYRFERFTLDTVRGALLAAGGTEVALRPKSFALLVRLVESAGRLVDRDEIMRAVWPDVVVTDDSITQCVREIRRALGDADQRLLRTLPRRGFLFAAEVWRENGQATVVVVPESVVGRGLAGTDGPAGAGVGAAPRGDPPVDPPADVLPRAEGPRPQVAGTPAPLSAGRPLVTVRPFEAIGGDEDGFADGLTADLLADLTRFRSLRVARVRPGGEAGGGAGERAGTIVGGAGSYVASGAVRRGTGPGGTGRTRVTAQLEDAETGVQLWADRFDIVLDGGDPLAAQEELAGRLAALLFAQVEQESHRRALRRPPASLHVYELVLRGRELYARVTEGDTLEARALFERAISLDPLYASAHAWAAYAIQRGLHYWWGEPTGIEACRVALPYARRAVELERDSSFCQSRLAFVLVSLGRHDEGLEAARESVRLNPRSSYARHALCDALMYGGEPEAAVAEARLALELDPFHQPGVRYHLGRALLLAGRHDEAAPELRQVAAELPDYGLNWHSLVVWAVETGRMDEARAAVRETLRIEPRWTLGTMPPVWPVRDPAQAARVEAAFRAAGLPGG